MRARGPHARASPSVGALAAAIRRAMVVFRPCPSNAQIRHALNFLHAAATTTTARPHPVGRVSAGRLPRSLCLSHARTKPRACTAW